MTESNCNACGTTLPRIACFCQRCGAPAARNGRRRTGWVWIFGTGIWIATGVATAVAGAGDWRGLEAGTGMLFSLLFLAGAVAVGSKCEN